LWSAKRGRSGEKAPPPGFPWVPVLCLCKFIAEFKIYCVFKLESEKSLEGLKNLG
jgi:hypothetical protein